MKRKRIFWLLAIFIFAFAPNPINASMIEVSTSPPTKLAEKNVDFTFNITFDPLGTEITAAQHNVIFNGSVLSVVNVSEGDLFNQSGNIPTVFNPGIIDNANGSLVNVWDLIIKPEVNITTKGNMTSISMTGTQNGTFLINLTNVIISDPSSNGVANNITIGRVKISPRFDIDGNFAVNILDLTILNQNWGKTGAAMCPQQEGRCDINRDGVVNIIDKTILQQNYGKKIFIG